MVAGRTDLIYLFLARVHKLSNVLYYFRELHHNKIGVIEPGAFEGLAELRKL